MGRRVLQFNLKAFNHIDFIPFKFNCFYFTFINHSNPNPSLLRVFAHNVVIHIQCSITHFVPCGYDTRLIVYITCVLNILVEKTYHKDINNLLLLKERA